MKVSDLLQKNTAQLKEELTALLKQQLSLRIKKSLQQLEDTSLLRKVKKDIARVYTVLTQLKKNTHKA